MNISNYDIVLICVIGWTFFWTWVNFGRMCYRQTVPVPNSIAMCIGWTAIITHIIDVW